MKLDRLLRPQAISNSVLLAALAVLFVYFTSQSATFTNSSNLLTLANNAAALGIIVVPFAMLVISGNIDFSVGSTAALSGTLLAVAVTQWGLSEGVGIVVALAAATIIGVVNGFLCIYLGFNPIIVTLGMLSVIRGGLLLVQQDQIYGIGPIIEAVGSDSILGVPITLWLAILTFALGVVFLTSTPWGRQIYAIGANKEAAYLSALPVRKQQFSLYVITSFAAGLAGLVFTARLNGVSPAVTGDNLEFQALTIVLLGGVAFAGGSGSLFGVLIAWLFLATLQNGLVLMNVTPYVQTVAAGVALVLAAALDRLGSTVVPKLRSRLEAKKQVESLTSSPGSDIQPRVPVGSGSA